MRARRRSRRKARGSVGSLVGCQPRVVARPPDPSQLSEPAPFLGCRRSVLILTHFRPHLVVGHAQSPVSSGELAACARCSGAPLLSEVMARFWFRFYPLDGLL